MMIPTAPVELPTAAALVEHLVSGIYGGCCICSHGCYIWLDLIAAGVQPVVDDDGALTDHVALHALCVSPLVEHWATLANHGGPGESTDPDDPLSDPETDGDHVPAGPAVPTTPLPPLGVYAQG